MLIVIRTFLRSNVVSFLYREFNLGFQMKGFASMAVLSGNL